MFLIPDVKAKLTEFFMMDEPAMCWVMRVSLEPVKNEKERVELRG